MTPVTPRSRRTVVTTAAKRFGYAVGIAVNAVLVYVAHHLLAWEVPAFLTEEWNEVLPIVTVSLVASMIVNALYLAYDATWFKSLTQVGLASISLVVAIRIYRVFPFAFAGDGFDWEPVTRGIVVVVTIAIAIGLIAEGVKLVRALAQMAPEDANPPPSVRAS